MTFRCEILCDGESRKSSPAVQCHAPAGHGDSAHLDELRDKQKRPISLRNSLAVSAFVKTGENRQIRYKRW